tara:strand:+ start:2021 stop:2404 length:384 start_codon:yes stop_codon:yes gene_type:complete
MKRFSQLIKEQNEFYDKFDNISDDVKEKIENTIKNSGGEYSSFIESFIKDDDVKIEGLINDSDVYDFYLKYTDDIDVILNDINFFDESPSERNVFGLYNYLVLGTNESVKEIVKNLYELNKNSEKDA